MSVSTKILFGNILRGIGLGTTTYGNLLREGEMKALARKNRSQEVLDSRAFSIDQKKEQRGFETARDAARAKVRKDELAIQGLRQDARDDLATQRFEAGEDQTAERLAFDKERFEETKEQNTAQGRERKLTREDRQTNAYRSAVIKAETFIQKELADELANLDPEFDEDKMSALRNSARAQSNAMRSLIDKIYDRDNPEKVSKDIDAAISDIEKTRFSDETQPPKSSNGGIPVITSQSEFDALSQGTRYRQKPDGQIFIKQ